MSKKFIGYILIALVAFGIGTQVNAPVKSLLSAMKSDTTATGNSTAKKPAVKKRNFNSSNAPDHTETANVGKSSKERIFHSAYLDADLVVPPNVFMPGEAEHKVLPLLSKYPDLFVGKTVLEIGSGSGPISIYAAKHGAVKVVATDISPDAIAAINTNAGNIGVGDIVEARLVSLDDMSAYSVIQPDEQFDIIISNPPYALDLDAPTNTAATDTGELGFSIVRGFETHLKPDGISLLFYDSLFYHQVMMKFARHEGYQVNNHNPVGLYTWAAETLFNSYLKRLLAKEKMDPDAFRFVRDKDGLNWKFLRNQGLDLQWIQYTPLMPGSDDMTYYPGWLAIQYSDETELPMESTEPASPEPVTQW